MVKAVKIVIVTVLAVVLCLLMLFGVCAAVCTFAPGKAVNAAELENPYIVKDGKAMVSAHRSGGDIAPENTMMAFENCINSSDFNVDVFEFDLHITKDGRLILLHDGTLDRTTNCVEFFGTEEVKPEDYTYKELLTLNFGENFQAPDGSFPYRGLRNSDIPSNLRATLLEDVLDYLESNGHFRYIIEIKNGGENGYKATDELYRILKVRNLLSDVVFGTFQGDVTEYADSHYPDLLRSSGIKEVVEFYFLATFGIKVSDDHFNYKALQIPANQFVAFRLGTERIINYAHSHNIAVQYWTINEPEEIERLSSIGADCIMSDNPSTAFEIING